MKKLLIALFTCLAIQQASAQKIDLTQIADSIKADGEALYRSEWASWYGTDAFGEKYPAKRAVSGGYISYDTGKGLTNIFFSRDVEPKVIATINFDYSFDATKYNIDTTQRKFNKTEKDLYVIRQAALKLITTDTLFKHYKNATLNVIPIINGKIKKVYSLTGPNVNGVVLLGNDYVIDFDKANNVTGRKKIHKSLIPIEIGENKRAETSMHTHLAETGPYITATDICTLKLYSHLSNWQSSIVTSATHVSIFDLKRNTLAILTREAYEKMVNDHTERKN